MTTDFSKATPRPWATYGNQTAIFGADRKQIISTDFYDGEGDTDAGLQTSIANAALIVAAVNAYGAGQADAVAPDDTAFLDGKDEAADFILETLAKALSLETFDPKDGSESWDGDVSATLYGILHAAGVRDEDTGVIATAHPPAASARIAELEAALRGMLAIIGDSRGVDGYHRNGNVAEWDEFGEVSVARDALAGGRT